MLVAAEFNDKPATTNKQGSLPCSCAAQRARVKGKCNNMCTSSRPKLPRKLKCFICENDKRDNDPTKPLKCAEINTQRGFDAKKALRGLSLL